MENQTKRLAPYLSVIIPISNQGDRLVQAVGDLRRVLGRLRQSCEMILVDGSGVSGSETIGRTLVSRARHVKYHRVDGKGYGELLRIGVGMARGEWVFCTSGDGGYDFRDLKELLRYTGSHDLIFGYRDWTKLTSSEKSDLRMHRGLLKWFFGFVLRDARCAFKLVRRQVFLEVPLTSVGEAVDYELLIRAVRAGFKIKEVPIQTSGGLAPYRLGKTIKILRELWKLDPKVGKVRRQHRRGKLGRIRMYLHRLWRLMADRPLEASLDVSGRCDLQCVSCGLWSEPIRGERGTSFWVKQADDLYRLGVRRVILIGAEPLMRDDIGRIARAISVRGMGVTLFTNGMRLRQWAAELVQSRVDRLVISIDGHDAGVHDGLRGGSGVFESAMEGYHEVIREATIRKMPTPECVFHMTLSIANAFVIPEIFNFAQRERADLTIQAVCQVPKEAIDKTQKGGRNIASRQYMTDGFDLLLSKDVAGKLKQRIRRDMMARRNLSAKVLLALKDDHFEEGTFPVNPCGHVHHTVSVNPQGMMYPCGMLANYHYGSLSDTSVWDLWHGERRKNLLKHLDENTFPVCKYCCHYLNNLTPVQAVRAMVGLSLK